MSCYLTPCVKKRKILVNVRHRTRRPILKALRMARADAGLTISELAERAGVSRDTISHAEKGRHGLQATTLHKIARALGKAPSELLAEEEKLAPKVESRSSLEPSFNDVLEDERLEAIYGPWLDFVNRYADGWDARIAAGDFDLSSLDEFVKFTETLMPTLHKLNAAEQQELPPQEFSFGLPAAKTGQAIGRLLDLLDPMLAAAAEKFPQDELEPLRRKRDEQFADQGRAAV
jgi:transcriptional regulator with XRE-family HTH domain